MSAKTNKPHLLTAERRKYFIGVAPFEEFSVGRGGKAKYTLR
jgi:hypothetical protein